MRGPDTSVSHPPGQILPTDSSERFDAAVRRAAELLRSGEVVALPTETVYGLAANALNPGAVAKIFRVKGRPAHNPLIVHVDGVAMARECTAAWPMLATRLVEAFWPGPLTLVLPRAPRLPDLVTAGGSTVGVRCPSHPFVQAVICACGFPLAAPSANLSSRLSPTTAEHVRQQLGQAVPLIVDGGPSPIGIESTVVDVSAHPPRLLRPGMIHEAALLAVTGELVAGSSEAGPVLRSPGMLGQHYAPRSPLVVWSWSCERELREQIAAAGVPPARAWIVAHTHIPSAEGFGGVSVIPHDAAAFARALYAELHRCDESRPELIVVEAPPAGGEWKAIADRLKRAAARPGG